MAGSDIDAEAGSPPYALWLGGPELVGVSKYPGDFRSGSSGRADGAQKEPSEHALSSMAPLLLGPRRVCPQVPQPHKLR